MENVKISVIVPCYNEEQNIYKNLTKIHSYLAARFTTFEIIVVNDGSQDKTAAEIRRFTASYSSQIIDCPVNTGKGSAVRQGILASNARHEVVMFLDADLAIPIEELQKFINIMDKKHADLVIASRFVPGLRVLEPVLFHRKLMEIAFRFLRATILNDWHIRDSQCGFKVFRRDAAMRIFSQTMVNRFAFDSEVIFLARKFNYRIVELPITLCNPPKSHIRIFFDPINMLLSLFMIRWNQIKGVYSFQQNNISQQEE